MWTKSCNSCNKQTIQFQKVDGKVATFGHGIAMDSAHGVFRLSVSLELRWASSAFFSLGGMFCQCSLRQAFNSCFSLAGTFRLACLWQAFLSSIILFCLASLLRAFISSLFPAVKLFRRAMSRSRLVWFMSFLMFAIVSSCWSIWVVKISSPLFVAPWSSEKEQAASRLSPLKRKLH